MKLYSRYYTDVKKYENSCRQLWVVIKYLLLRNLTLRMNCFAVYLEFFGHNCCILSPLLNYLINICLVKSSFLTSYRLTYEENVVTEGTIQLNSWKQREQLFDKYSRFSWRQRMQKRHSLGNKRNICVC